MSSKVAGSRVGGKGTWRRKGKKVSNQNQEADKLWLACQRAGCRDIGEIDSASMVIAKEDNALSFTKPELAVDMRANTYVLKGKPEKKPVAEVLTELLQGIDFSKLAKKDESLGDVENVDFSKPAEEEKKEE